MKLIAPIMTIIILCGFATVTASVPDNYALANCIRNADTRSVCIRNGDVTADGELTAADAQAAFFIALGLEPSTEEVACYADCNGDFEITAGDAQGIFFSALGTDACQDPLPSTEMILIPAGTFQMGSPELPEPELCRGVDEIQHTVTLSHNFLMQATEVTQWQWEAIFGEGSNPSFYVGAWRPVEQVTFYDILIYCNRLSVQEGLLPCYYDDPELTRVFAGIPPVTTGTAYWDESADGYRLPTEAEWEYACRGGTSAPFNNGLAPVDCDADVALETIAWYEPNAVSISQVVGSKEANDYGLFDMHGNVWEWAWDRYGEYPGYPVTDPSGPGPEGGIDRIIRGGSVCDIAGNCRSASRESTTPGYAYY